MESDLIGRTIKEVRKMTPEEMDSEGWDGQPPTVLILDNGTKLYPSADDEGNGPGSLFGRNSDGCAVAWA